MNTSIENLQTLSEKVAQLEETVRILLEYVEQRKIQQISYPLDEASRNVLNESL